MFGYATDETKELMPLTLVLAHALNRKMAEEMKNGNLAWLRPDVRSTPRRHRYQLMHSLSAVQDASHHPVREGPERHWRRYANPRRHCCRLHSAR